MNDQKWPAQIVSLLWVIKTTQLDLDILISPKRGEPCYFLEWKKSSSQPRWSFQAEFPRMSRLFFITSLQKRSSVQIFNHDSKLPPLPETCLVGGNSREFIILAWRGFFGGHQMSEDLSGATGCFIQWVKVISPWWMWTPTQQCLEIEDSKGFLYCLNILTCCGLSYSGH